MTLSHLVVSASFVSIFAIAAAATARLIVDNRDRIAAAFRGELMP